MCGFRPCIAGQGKVPFSKIYHSFIVLIILFLFLILLISSSGRKKYVYNERVLNVEKGNFTPLVFLTSGGMSKECKQRFINRLANL